MSVLASTPHMNARLTAKREQFQYSTYMIIVVEPFARREKLGTLGRAIKPLLDGAHRTK